MERISKNRLREIIRKMINEEVDRINVRAGGGITMDKVENGITLYHRPKDNYTIVGGKSMLTIDSVFRYGFSREFTGSNGGNMYGAGVYTVYKLSSSLKKATGYGHAIIKLKLIGGYKDFLIFSKPLAKQIYGEHWHIEEQLRYLFGKDADDIIRRCSPIVMHTDEPGSDVNSSSCCLRIKDYFENHLDVIRRSKIRGYVYNGGHDGACCFIMDFQSAIPIAASTDGGRTWKPRLTQELMDRLSNEVDTEFQFGQNYKEVSEKSINGYVIVWNNQDKANYIEADENHPISDVWFDKAFAWERQNGILAANVVYEGYELYLTKENGEYMVYSTDWEPQCTLKELPSLVEG